MIKGNWGAFFKVAVILYICCAVKPLIAQFNIGVNSSNSDAVLQLQGADSSQGVLTPVVTQANRPACNSTNESMLIYNITDSVIQYCNGTVWVNVKPSALEDLDKDTKVQVEESADEDKIRFDTKGVERMIIDDNGNVGIGTNSPGRPLVVHGDGVNNTSVFIANNGFTQGSAGSTLAIGQGAATGNTYSYINATTGGGGVAGSLILNAPGGNIGIGTTNPLANVHVFTRTGNSMIMTEANNGLGQVRKFTFGTNNTDYNLHIVDNTHPGTSDFFTGYYSSGNIVLAPTRGNIGIGTTSPATRFHIHNDASGSDSAFVVNSRGFVGMGTTSTSFQFEMHGASPNMNLYRYDDSTVPAVFRANKARGSVGSPTATLNGDDLGGIYFGGHNGTTWANNTAFLKASAFGNYTSGSTGSSMHFFVTDTGAVAAQEAVTIEYSGNVGIGTSAPEGLLEVKGGQWGTPVVENGNASGATSIDWSTGNTQHIILTGDVTLTFSNGLSGRKYVLIIKQDATGGHAVTWPGDARFSDSGSITVTTTASKTDYIGFFYNPVDATYDNLSYRANY